MRTNYIIGLFCATLAFISCERNTEDTLGPNLSDIYGEFQVFEPFTADKQNVDFSTGQSVRFSSRFSKTVDWQIRIVGQNSGAIKLLSGKSKVIDEITGTWDGSTTLLPMFKTEPCKAYLEILEENFTDSLTNLNIDSTKTNDGFEVAHFENGLNPGWDIFAQSGANMTFTIAQSDSAAEKQHFYDMGGEVTFDYLIGYIYFPATAYGEVTFPLNENPNDVFFNVMLSKPPQITNEIILFQFTEDENGDGVFQPNSEDMYSLELKNIESAWSLISVKYADLTALVNGAPAAPNGNGIHEPDKLLEVRTLFLADPTSGYSQTFMDYIIFTESQPLKP